ncbi:MAG: LysM peptidoglycan-binding domain-containing protein [Chloroflexi bacterium]|nr:LysM peptidoglycan-binding domain-containing protein [Chloroflexota bacterium]
MNPKPLRLIILAFWLLLGIFALVGSPLQTDPANAQIFFYTPTAESNGNIYYAVKEGENCESIALLVNIPIETLRTLNQLEIDQCEFLQVDRKLLIGSVPTPIITSAPPPAPTSNIPTPLPILGYGKICVYLYNDINGNAMAESAEVTNTGLAGGEISISNSEEGYSKNGTTLDTGEPVCFENAPEGKYSISVAIPDGYNPTSDQNFSIQLKAGDTSTIDFSAQASSTLNLVKNEGGSSVFLAVVGGLVLVAGILLGLYVKWVLKK